MDRSSRARQALLKRFGLVPGTPVLQTWRCRQADRSKLLRSVAGRLHLTTTHLLFERTSTLLGSLSTREAAAGDLALPLKDITTVRKVRGRGRDGEGGDGEREADDTSSCARPVQAKHLSFLPGEGMSIEIITTSEAGCAARRALCHHKRH